MGTSPLRLAVHALRSLLGTNGLASGIHALQCSVDALTPRPQPPPAVPPINLPAGMRRLHIEAKDARRPGFDLVLPDMPGPYDEIQLAHRHYSDIAYLLALELDGAGTLIDLGANIGTVALPVAAAGSHVVAVEMLPANVLRLVLAAAANALPHLWPVNAAVSDVDGTVRFVGAEAWASVTQGPGQEALCLRLDTILAGIAGRSPGFLRPPFALKIDVEGHEYEALRGAERFLAAHRPVVMFESIQLDIVLESTLRCKELLTAAGYRLFMLRDQLLIPKRPADIQEELVGDFLALPAERAEATLARFPGFHVRQPTAEERLRWLETLLADTDDHRRHALQVIDALAAADPAFATTSADLRRRIETALHGP